MLEKLLCNTSYFKMISYEKALELVTQYMADPPMNTALKDYHSEMLNRAVRRDVRAREYVKAMISRFLDDGSYKVEGMTHDRLVQKLYQDMYGLGPIEPLIDDPEIQEVNVNGYDNIWYEKKGHKYRAKNLSFQDDEKLKQVIDRCLPEKEVNRLETFAQSNFDQSRIYVGIPPVAKKPYLNYRKFSVFAANEANYLETETLTEEALEVLKILIAYRTNVAIIGPQNTGKTTLLSFLTDYFPPNFRIGVLESPEFEVIIDQRRKQRNVFFLKTVEKLGVTELDIFKHALRFSADVLIIPEARGAEMEEVLKAQRRGNRGSMTTLHSISPQNLVDDMAIMISETGKSYQLSLLKMMVAKALDIIITMHHFSDGTRKVINISEVDYDEEQEKIIVNELFTWKEEKLVRTKNQLCLELAYSLQFYGAKREELKNWGLIR